MIAACASIDAPGWLELRQALWPETREAHVAEMAAFLAEAAIRSDYVNGTQSSPVAFLEGLYVAPAFRRRGIARLLVAEIICWAKARGCHELASDALLDNTAHRALGFEESERVVFFRKRL